MEILSVERLTDERWANLFAARYRHRGKEGRWVFASRHADPPLQPAACDAVVIVPRLLSEGPPPRLVLLKEFRVPVGGYVYAFPAGLIEPGESVEDVARRELREETGFEVTAVRRVTPPLYSSAGITDEAILLAYVDARAVPGSVPSPEASEEFEVLTLDFGEVCRLGDSQERFDAKTWLVLDQCRQRGSLE